MPLPLVATNFFIILSISLVYFLVKNRAKIGRIIPLAILTGAVFSVANSFRPVMLIFVIALAIYFALILLRKPQLKIARNFAISFILLIISFFVLNFSYVKIVSAATGFSAEMSGGWSFFVGANYSIDGRWNSQDEIHRNEILRENSSISEMHAQLFREGIDRYKNLSPAQLADFLVKKSLVLGGDPEKLTVVDINTYPNFYASEKVRILIWLSNSIFMLFLLVFSLIFFLKNYRDKSTKLNFSHFLAVAFFGLFAAFMFVEVAPRYFAPFFIFLIIFAALSFREIRLKNPDSTENLCEKV